MSNILDHHTNDYNNRTTIVIKSKSDESLKNLSIAIDNDQEDFDGNDHDNRNQFIINESSSSSLNNNDEDNLKLFDQQQVLSSPNTTTDLYNNNSRNKPYLSTSYSFPGVRDYLLFGDCTNNTTTTAISFKDRSTTTTPLTNLSDSFAQLYLPNFAQHISTTIMSGLNWINQINAATLFQNFWTSSGFFRRRFSSSSSSTVSSSSSNTNNHHSIAQQSNNQNVDDLTYRQYKFAKILNGTIRLHTLKPSELIELSSFGLVELDTDVEPGIGHEFQRYENDKATWCDSCGEFLFPPVMDDINNSGIGDSKTKQYNNNNNNNNDDYDVDVGPKNIAASTTKTTKTSVSVQADHLLRTYFQCTKCKYVCHWKCLDLIRIDCRQHSPQSTMIPSSNNDMAKSGEIDSNNNNNNNIDDEQKDDQNIADIISITNSIDSFDVENNQSTFSTETSFADDSDDESSETTTTMTTSNNSMTSVFNNDDDINSKNENIECKKIQSENNNVNQQTAAVVNKSSIIESYLITPRIILDLRAKILKYNERVRSRGSGLGITLIDEERCLFRGFLRVHMNLTRPINVIAGKRPPSIYDIINEEENNQNQRRTLTSFYMPRDTVKNIHITSDSTSLQVIKAMLKKFKVVDNPQKFALYLRRRFPQEELNKNGGDEVINNDLTRISDDNQNEMTISKFLKTAGHEHSLKRLHDHERPLILQLEFDSFAYGSVDIVLQENDNADIAWDAFEVPELRNFLKILEREEGEHLEHVKNHYHEMHRILKALIDYEESRLLKNSNNNNNNNNNNTGNQSDDNNILTVTS
ncbi:uncharacterized protein LOC124498703 isoform X2 [Dermatophagoides farinae]|uniref:uncharacterized protein LOC124498703 isoform X2 n=1 Tax=Dermatophagoides farinae TaxID=6954 RepID=UPI003F632732